MLSLLLTKVIKSDCFLKIFLGSCFSDLVTKFISCWHITLITLATGPLIYSFFTYQKEKRKNKKEKIANGPFIVIVGGIFNIFLHKLAENT